MNGDELDSLRRLRTIGRAIICLVLVIGIVVVVWRAASELPQASGTRGEENPWTSLVYAAGLSLVLVLAWAPFWPLRILVPLALLLPLGGGVLLLLIIVAGGPDSRAPNTGAGLAILAVGVVLASAIFGLVYLEWRLRGDPSRHGVIWSILTAAVLVGLACAGFRARAWEVSLAPIREARTRESERRIRALRANDEAGRLPVGNDAGASSEQE
jgi:hypothetical protein